MQDVAACKRGRKRCPSRRRGLRIAGDSQTAERENAKTRHDRGDAIV